MNYQQNTNDKYSAGYFHNSGSGVYAIEFDIIPDTDLSSSSTYNSILRSRYNPNKFSPAYRPLSKRFVNKQRTRIALIYRPVPHFVDYTLSIWAEHKRDAEYALYQVLLRFNPLAEIRISDNHTIGNVQMEFDSYSDNSDKEASAEQHAKVMYEVSYTAEAWLSLPERVVPTILGPIATAKEVVGGEILLGPQRGQV